jgi:hypothetical protein
VSVIAAALLVLAGCARDERVDSGRSTTDAPAGSSTTSSSADAIGKPYALVGDRAWTFVEAVDLRGDEPTATVTRPFVDWYVEYRREWPTGSSATDTIPSGTAPVPGMSVGVTVTMTAHDETIDQVRADLEAYGVTFRRAQAGPWSVLVGRTDRSPVVVVDGAPVLMLNASAELSDDGLLAVAATIERVDEATWLAAGGRKA